MNRSISACVTLILLGATTALMQPAYAQSSSPSQGGQGALDAPPTYAFSLDSQPMAEALKIVGRQASKNILFDPSLVEGLEAPALHAEVSIERALQTVLAGTQIRFESIGADTIVLRKATTKPTARADIGTSAATSASSAPEGGQLAEIIVTAEKHEERLQDVPVPVTVLSANVLTEENQLRLQDYYNKVPGLGLALISDGSEPVITIRGITTGGFTNPTVGVVVDDVSYGATINPGTAPSAPDIDPGDLARVEVLRGPQGTLYGASSMGGLLKFVTVDPDPTQLSGRVQIGTTTVYKGDDLGYNVRGSVNVPITDTLALRASSFKLREPGYIKNVQTGEDGVNRRDSKGGRLSALWKPANTFSLKLSALLQDSHRDGTSDIDSTLGAAAFEQRALAGTGVYGRKTQAYGATMAGLLGKVQLVSATGYNIDTVNTEIDQSAAFGSTAVANFGVTGVAGPFERKIDKFSQELRASIPLGANVSWLVGAFYTSESIHNHLLYAAEDQSTAAPAGTLYKSDTTADFHERALFTNFTLDVTQRFDVQVGGRLSRNTQDFATVRSGPLAIRFFGKSPSAIAGLDSHDSVSTYLVTPRFKVSDDLMLYTRLASGYRPGGPNTGCGIPTVPCAFKPDRTQNYELGVKGDMFDRLLSFDASAYYIDWQDIQTSLTIGGFGYQDNAGRAKSDGVELSVESEPVMGLKLAAWGAWNDAELTQGFPAAATNVSGKPGDRLPYSSRISGSVSADQRFPIGASANLTVGGSFSYVGDRKGMFRAPNVARETFPSYTQLDLHTAFSLDDWTVNAFVNNLTNQRGIFRSGLDSLRPTFLTYIQPRTIGLSVARSF